jgi:hypothetical protein
MIRDFPFLRSLTATALKQDIASAPGPRGLDQTIERSGRGATAI